MGAATGVGVGVSIAWCGGGAAGGETPESTPEIEYATADGVFYATADGLIYAVSGTE